MSILFSNVNSADFRADSLFKADSYRIDWHADLERSYAHPEEGALICPSPKAVAQPVSLEMVRERLPEIVDRLNDLVWAVDNWSRGSSKARYLYRQVQATDFVDEGERLRRLDQAEDRITVSRRERRAIAEGQDGGSRSIPARELVETKVLDWYNDFGPMGHLPHSALKVVFSLREVAEPAWPQPPDWPPHDSPDELWRVRKQDSHYKSRAGIWRDASAAVPVDQPDYAVSGTLFFDAPHLILDSGSPFDPGELRLESLERILRRHFPTLRDLSEEELWSGRLLCSSEPVFWLHYSESMLSFLSDLDLIRSGLRLIHDLVEGRTPECEPNGTLWLEVNILNELLAGTALLATTEKADGHGRIAIARAPCASSLRSLLTQSVLLGVADGSQRLKICDTPPCKSVFLSRRRKYCSDRCKNRAQDRRRAERKSESAGRE